MASPANFARPRSARSPQAPGKSSAAWRSCSRCASASLPALSATACAFWLAAAVFVTVSIAVLQFAERSARNLRLRGLAFALAVGVAAGIVVTLVFQELFLVRLP